MKRLYSTFVLLAVLLIVPFVTGCAEKEPVAIFIPQTEIILNPGDEVFLEVFADYGGDSELEPVLISEGLLFFSSREELLTVEPDGRVHIRSQVLNSGKVLTGESGELHVKYGNLKTSCRVLLIPNPEDSIDPMGFLIDPESIDALVNKTRSLPEDYEPPLLTRVSVPTCLTFQEVNHLRRPAAAALSRMFTEAEDEEGYKLIARSGYRSHKTQAGLYQMNVENHGQEYADKYSARPGTSEHQTGLAMDITSKTVNNQLVDNFGETPEGVWVHENCHRFGFILRYLPGKEDVTGYNYEPWHLRYVGEVLATEIYSRGLTLEEFYDLGR
ncbi:MAG: M15 family metallopeptidase [Spirochaetales bacterium]|nr:M15 family metallopeptidase [Spirochaetales bacterium]